MSRLSRRASLLLGLAVGVLVIGTAAAAVTLLPQSGTVATESDSGLTVRVSESVGVPSGNPFTPTGIELSNVEFASPGGGELTVDASGSVWTNTSRVSTGDSDLRINRSDTRPINVSGAVTDINVRSLDLAESDQTTEMRVTASSDWVLEIDNTGLSSGRGVVVVNSNSGDVLDASPVENDGSVRFDELQAVSDSALTIKRGASELRVFDETQPTELVTGTTLRIRFIQGDSSRVVEREVTNGRVDLSGVPRDQRVSVTVDEQDASDYAYRRITLENVQEQQEVYLLNTSRDTAQPLGIVFELQDRTGRFSPADTTLRVQKPITKDHDGDGDDETRFQTVAGDVVGASGEFPATLAADNRYRLTVVNSDGDQRVLGSYVARQSERSVLRIGQVSFDFSGEGPFAVDLTTNAEDTDDDGTDELFARIVYRDPGERTQELDWQLENESGVVTTDTISGPLGNYTASIKIAENASRQRTETLTLNWTVVRSQPDGADETLSGTRLAGDVQEIAGILTVESRWLELMGYVMLVAVTGLVVVVDAALASIVAVVLGGLLTVLGVLGIPLPALGLGGAVAMMALLGRTRT